MKKLICVLQFGVVAMLLPGSVWGGKLACPDSENNPREVMATSAPEIRVRANVQDDSRRWAETIRPLTQKAIRLAKEQRAKYIQEGIERGCGAPQVYVGQIVPVANRTSGCDSKTVTRPGEADQLWVQVIATCKYAWACCTPEDDKEAFNLEGPLAPLPPGTSPAATSKEKKASKE